MSETPPAPAQSSKLLWIVVTGAVLAVAGASFLFSTALSNFDPQANKPLPILREVREPFAAPERLGGTKQILDLKDKVVVAAFAYTRCPHGCAGVAIKMKELRDAFQGEEDFHLVSVAAWPEIDSPENLKQYARTFGVADEDPWWWLSTERQKAWDWMSDGLGFGPSREVPEEQRLNPEDRVEHDLRAVLVDQDLQVRGYYALMHPQTEVADMATEKLERDIRRLLAE